MIQKLFSNRWTRPYFNPAMRALVKYLLVRAAMNALHNRLSYRQSEAFFWAFGSAFRGVSDKHFRPSVWTVRFGDAKVMMPLESGGLWQMWGLAIGARGHDSEVKQTYVNILRSSVRPELFLDLGANNGVHSLLFASNGVHALAFEPNPNCAEVAARLYALNRVDVDWYPFAVGSKTGDAVLNFPLGDTSLGFVSEDAVSSEELTQLRVRQVKLDDQVVPPGTVLMKMDLEGHELAALVGGAIFLKTRKPIILFESNRGDPNRNEVLAFLELHDYAVYRLPWKPGATDNRLGREVFVAIEETNFIAVPISGTPMS